MKRRNRIFIFGIPLIAILTGLLLYNYGVFGLGEGKVSSIKEEQAVNMRTLEMYYDLLGQVPELDKTLKSLKEQEKNEEAKLIPGDTVALAGANMQDIVRSILTGNGGSVYSERINKTEPLGKYTLISISVDAMLPGTEALGSVLYGIESRTPYMVVGELDVKVRNINSPKDLTLTLNVKGLSATR